MMKVLATPFLLLCALLAVGCDGPGDSPGNTPALTAHQLGRGTFRVKQDGAVRGWVSRTTPSAAACQERWILHDNFETIDADAPAAKAILTFEYVNEVEYTTWATFKNWVTTATTQSGYDGGGLKPSGELHNVKFELLP